MLTRDLEKAKEAYKSKDKDASRIAHENAIANENHQGTAGKYIKSIIYGGLDGTITTFAAVAGVAGASLAPGIVLIIGFANLIADGLSMSIGDYLSTKSEREYNKAEREREAWEVEHYPEGEKKELTELYVAKGMQEADAKAVTEIISKDKKSWVDIMMVEELGILDSDENPLFNALATFASFFIFGFLPMLMYVLALFIPYLKPIQFPLACIVTALTLFSLGAIKTRITGKSWFLSGMEMMLVGGVAAVAAYVIGMLLGGLA